MRLTFGFLCMFVASMASAAEPVLAILDSGQWDRVPLLEAELLKQPGIVLVDRAAVAGVLKEQQLQAAFGPQGVGDRVQLGKILKADVLVLLRPVKESRSPALEVVIGETSGGLRLSQRALPLSSDAAADTAALVDAIREGLQKHREQVKQIVAVPPFVSENLTFEFDHLKGAFAKIAEQTALSQPGIVVVELAEAEAVAKELALAAPGGTVSRLPPLYLLGEFKHERAAGKPGVALVLRAERSGKPVGTTLRTNVAPGDAPQAIRDWSLQAIGLGGSATPQAVPDPRVEAQQLARRAREFKRIANWDECLDLVEASLLLDPDQVELRSEAAYIAGSVKGRVHLNVIVKNERGTLPDPARLKAATLRTLQVHARARDHAEWLILHATPDQSRYVSDAVVGWITSRFVYSNPRGSKDHSPAVNELVRQSREEDRRRMLPLANRVLELYPGGPHSLAQGLMEDLPPTERFAILEQILTQFPDNADARRSSEALLRSDRVGQITHSMGPEYEAYLQRLTASETPWLRAAAIAARRGYEERKQAIRTPRPPVPETAIESDQVKLVPLTPPIQDGDAIKIGFTGVAPVGPGIDVFWSGHSVYVMKEKGQWKHVLPAGPDIGFIKRAHSDGRYLWLATGHGTGNPDRLVVFDPAAEKFQELPIPAEVVPTTGSMELNLTTYAPGKACVVGSFTRTWVALVSLSEDLKAKEFKVVVEAREAQDRNNSKQYLSTGVTFRPGYMVPVQDHRGGASPDPLRIFVERSVATAGGGTFNNQVHDNPLAIDPARGTVEVVKSPFRRSQNAGFNPGPDGVYFYDRGLVPDRNIHLCRLRAHGVQDVVARVGPEAEVSHLVLSEGLLHYVRNVNLDAQAPRTGQWWIASTDGQEFRQAAAALPAINRVWQSHHYGLIAQISPRPLGAYRIYAVEIRGAKSK